MGNHRVTGAMGREPMRSVLIWRGWQVGRGLLEFVGIPVSHLPIDLTDAGAPSLILFSLSGGALVYNRGTAWHQPPRPAPSGTSTHALQWRGLVCPCTVPSQWCSCWRGAPLPPRRMLSTKSAQALHAEKRTGRGIVGTTTGRLHDRPACLLAREDISASHPVHQHEWETLTFESTP